MPFLLTVAKYVVNGDSTTYAVQIGIQNGQFDAALKFKPSQTIDQFYVYRNTWDHVLGCVVPLSALHMCVRVYIEAV